MQVGHTSSNVHTMTQQLDLGVGAVTRTDGEQMLLVLVKVLACCII
jgi:hypothetical protein